MNIETVMEPLRNLKSDTNDESPRLLRLCTDGVCTAFAVLEDIISHAFKALLINLMKILTCEVKAESLHSHSLMKAQVSKASLC